MAILAAVSTASIFAADVEVNANANANSNPPKVEAQVNTDRDNDAHHYKQEVRIESTVKPVNKAHDLVGMEVRNRNDEKLGEIKDLVVDLQTGRIAYATIAVGGFLGVGEKLIAVPTSALMVSDRSNKYVIMDATRGELMDAPGIAATNWPDYRNPNYNERPFFNPRAHGAAAGSETGRGKLYTDANRHDAGVDVNVNHDADRDTRSHVAIGRIESINGHSVIIENAGRTETYSIHGNAIRASDYKNGDRVTVKYHTDANGKMVIDDLSRQ
jgi:sporulation protein YlmC with PRC-barrel domain